MFDLDGLIADFIKVAKLAGHSSEFGDRKICKKHWISRSGNSTKLPKDYMAVYVFSYGEKTLKVGKVGPSNNSRYTSQHYKVSEHIGSTLAKSIWNDPKKEGG